MQEYQHNIRSVVKLYVEFIYATLFRLTCLLYTFVWLGKTSMYEGSN